MLDFNGFKKKQQEVEEYKKSMLKIIDDFILYDEDFRMVHASLQLDRYVKSTDFHFKANTIIVEYFYFIQHTFNTVDHIEFLPDEYKRLEEFMKNPELYKNKKKYNL